MNSILKNRISLASKILTKGIWQSNATILMYHRIADVRPDPWLLGVSPDNFRQQMDVLKQYEVTSMQQMIENLKAGKLSRSLAITFDDGYKDNFYSGMPILREYGLPATFFISSGFTTIQKEFWSNELGRILLTPGVLPETLNLHLGDIQFLYHLGKDALITQDQLEQFQHWIAWETPPTQRHAMYVKIANLIKSKPLHQEEALLNALYQWSGKERIIDATNLMMNENEIKETCTDRLFEIGGHTVTHPELSTLSSAGQYKEVKENIDFLQEIVRHPITGMAYPYGAYNEETIKVVEKAGLQYACTSFQNPVSYGTSSYTLPRLRVRNWNGKEFKERINRWLRLGI